jgi:hypothetical protein
MHSLRVGLTKLSEKDAILNPLSLLFDQITKSEKKLMGEGVEERLPVEDIAVQVSTLGLSESPESEGRRRSSADIMEEDRTRLLPSVSVSADEVETPNLTRVDIYKNELEKAIQDSKDNLLLLEDLLSKSKKDKPTHENLVRQD